jgi:hypothetical protein
VREAPEDLREEPEVVLAAVVDRPRNLPLPRDRVLLGGHLIDHGQHVRGGDSLRWQRRPRLEAPAIWKERVEESVAVVTHVYEATAPAMSAAGSFWLCALA